MSLRSAVIGLAVLGVSDLSRILAGNDPVLALAEKIRPSYKGPASRTAPRSETGRRIRAKRTDATPPPGPRHYGYDKVSTYNAAGVRTSWRWVERLGTR